MKNKSHIKHFFLIIYLTVASSLTYAEVYKCKDAQNKITYQSTPCLTNTVGKVRKDADIPEADRLRAQERVDAVFERERQREAAAESERLARQESEKKFQLEQEARVNEKRKINLLERQAIAAEEAAMQAKAARVAAERAERAASENQRIRCRPDYAGGLVCN